MLRHTPETVGISGNMYFKSSPSHSSTHLGFRTTDINKAHKESVQILNKIYNNSHMQNTDFTSLYWVYSIITFLAREVKNTARFR